MSSIIYSRCAYQMIVVATIWIESARYTFLTSAEDKRMEFEFFIDFAGKLKDRCLGEAIATAVSCVIQKTVGNDWLVG
eukprot:1332993-Amorphochlora_amoeboformis.AAC.2